MSKKNDKKTIIILLIILAIAIIGGGIWTYNISKPLEPIETPKDNSDPLVGLSIDTVYSIKDEAKFNINDFLITNDFPDNIWDDFYGDEQFNSLKDNSIEIDISDYANNPNPFVIPSSTEEEL